MKRSTFFGLFVLCFVLCCCFSTAQRDNSLHILPLQEDSRTITLSGSIACFAGCTNADKLILTIAIPETAGNYQIKSIQPTLFDYDSQAIFSTKMISPTQDDQKTFTLLLTDLPVTTGYLGYSMIISLNKDLSLKSETTFTLSYSPAAGEAVNYTKSFTPVGQLSQDDSDRTYINLLRTHQTLESQHFEFLIDRIESDLTNIQVALFGQLIWNKDKFAGSSCTLNGVDVTSVTTIVDKLTIGAVSQDIPTMNIAYSSIKDIVPISKNVALSLVCTLSLGTIPVYDSVVPTYASVVVSPTNVIPPLPPVTYNALVTLATDPNLPTLTSTAFMDGNYLYHVIDVAFPTSTNIDSNKYFHATRRFTPSLAYLYVANSTWYETYDPEDETKILSRDRLTSTIQSDKIYYNSHSGQTSKKSINIMFSREFVSAAYTVYIVAPLNSKEKGGVAQFGFFYSILNADGSVSQTLQFSAVYNPTPIPAIVQYPQFDAILDSKNQGDKTETPTEGFELLFQTAPLSDDGERITSDLTSKLTFTALLKKTKAPVTSAELKLIGNQYVIVGDVENACTINGKSVKSVAVPLVNTPDQYSALKFTGLDYSEGSNVEFVCKKAFIRLREQFQTESIAYSYFPIQLLTSSPKGDAGNTVLFHFPNHSATKDWIFIVTCWIVALISIPGSQLLLCWCHPKRKPDDFEDDQANDSLINGEIDGIESEEGEEISRTGGDRFTRPMHSVHRRINLVTQSEDPHH